MINLAGADWYDTQDLAQILRLTTGAILKMIRSSKLPGTKIGRKFYYRKESVAKWLSARESASGRKYNGR